MNLRNVSAYISVILLLLVLVIPSDAICAKEDTTYLLFKKTALSKENLQTYIVKKGDFVTKIIYKQLGAESGDIYKILKIVKRLNPKTKNMNRILPGQKLILPGKNVLKNMKTGNASLIGKETALADAGMGGIPFIPKKNYLPVIKHTINRLDGSAITEGNYYIPIPPAGQVAINCSTVPVVELDDGNKILLDLSSQIPDDLKKMIESTWRNYSIVKGKKGILSLLEEIINKSETYSFKKFGKHVKVGKTPQLKIWLDWLVSNKTSTKENPRLHGLNLVKNDSHLIPLPIKKYAEKNYLTITEIMEKSGIANAADENYTVPYLPTINSSTNRELAVSLLITLGYTPTKNTEVKVFDSIKDGFTLSVNADLLIKAEGKSVIINFKKISQQFINIFKKRGTKIIFISEGERKKEIFQKVLYAMNIPFSADNFEFLIPEKANNPRAIIYLPSIKVRVGKNATYHFVDFDVDDGINGLLHKKWGVNLIKY
jgi:LysM repeat protein